MCLCILLVSFLKRFFVALNASSSAPLAICEDVRAGLSLNSLCSGEILISVGAFDCFCVCMNQYDSFGYLLISNARFRVGFNLISTTRINVQFEYEMCRSHAIHLSLD